MNILFILIFNYWIAGANDCIKHLTYLPTGIQPIAMVERGAMYGYRVYDSCGRTPSPENHMFLTPTNSYWDLTRDGRVGDDLTSPFKLDQTRSGTLVMHCDRKNNDVKDVLRRAAEYIVKNKTTLEQKIVRVQPQQNEFNRLASVYYEAVSICHKYFNLGLDNPDIKPNHDLIFNSYREYTRSLRNNDKNRIPVPAPIVGQ
jgi:hypothetical protein